jgi:hypothetical protein
MLIRSNLFLNYARVEDGLEAIELAFEDGVTIVKPQQHKDHD